MKKIRTCFTILILIVVCTVVAYADSFSKYTGSTYIHSDRFDTASIVNAIDVSQYQKNIDWSKVKADGIEYAIIRIGGRGYAENGRLYFDDYYKRNIENAKGAGIKIGIYYFSQAKTEAEAIEEANHCIQLLGNYEIDLPIFMDYEHASDSNNPGRIKDLTSDQRTANAIAFCETIEQKGYEAGFYSNLLFLRNSIDGNKISSLYTVWAAQYYDRCQYENYYSIWQYSSDGRVDGIEGRVDCNFWYIIPINSLSPDLAYYETMYDGTKKEPKVNISGLTEGRDFEVRYENNINVGTGKVIIKGKGLYSGTIEKYFTITQADISKKKVELSYTETFFDGEAKMPSVTIPGLAENEDFIVTYKNNINIGTAEVIITGKGNYKGTIKETFLIKKNLIGAEAVFYESNKIRIYGSNRYETSLLTAEQLKLSLGINRFDTVIVASGENYADALSGSYLAHIKNAPILTINKYNENLIAEYINSNLKKGGKVYLLGGESIISTKFEKSLSDYSVKRLWGDTRYETNIAILRECGVTDEDLLICSGNDYADSLSASATGKPILIVNTSLSTLQKDFISDIESNRCYIIGGTGAVTGTIEKQLKDYGKNVKRISGENRYETSAAVADWFFDKSANTMFLAYGDDFPDGLVSGSLAKSLNAPVILVTEKNIRYAQYYSKANSIQNFAAVIGPAFLSEEAYGQIARIDK